ncbi:MAG: hypothetical protein LBQ40_02280 [Clostridiales bacterium]|nr:hypothetical protein [Clostridiales bacterium]
MKLNNYKNLIIFIAICIIIAQLGYLGGSQVVLCFLFFLIMLGLCIIALGSKKLVDIYIQRKKLKLLFYVEFFLKLIMLYWGIVGFVNIENIIFLPIFYLSMVVLSIVLILLNKKTSIKPTNKEYEFIENMDTKKIRNSFLISFILIIVSNAVFYLFDIDKYDIYALLLFFAICFIFLILYFSVIRNLISAYKGKINNKFLGCLFVFLFICSNIYFYLIGEYVGRNMIISIYMLLGILFNFPYFLFKEKLTRNLFKYKDKG